MDNTTYKWWQKTIVYQIYPRSFKDSTGNGIGDLQGIIENLDYLYDLGIDSIWISPFFVSPQQDHGYDVANFREVDPVYGKMDTFNNLLKEIHERDMKLILDLVLNHTSTEHPWFKESASSRNNPKRDWYIWRDGKKPEGKKPPNNWNAIPGGSAWKYHENTRQWYYFHFLPFQPDLNYRNPEVKKEMFNTLRFWLDKGVDGFRLDILHTIFEDFNLKNNPFTLTITESDKKSASLFQYHKYDTNLPETYDFVLELRKLMDEYDPERFMVGEVFGTLKDLKKYYGTENNGLHMAFLFEFTSKVLSFKPKKIVEIISKIEQNLPPPLTPTYVYGNHDRDRYISRLKNDVQKAKLLVTLQLTLRGVPYIYYGEEIGMFNVRFNLKTSEDPIGRKFSKFPFPQISKLIGFSLTRDRCRTPMQWSNELNAGFTPNPQADTWLKIAENYREINVYNEQKNPNSLLNCYKNLIKLRNETICLQEGSFEFINPEKFNKKCIAYKRIHSVDEIYVFLNFSRKELLLKSLKPEPKLLFSTKVNRNEVLNEKKKIYFRLNPFEGIIFQ